MAALLFILLGTKTWNVLVLPSGPFLAINGIRIRLGPLDHHRKRFMYQAVPEGPLSCEQNRNANLGI